MHNDLFKILEMICNLHVQTVHILHHRLLVFHNKVRAGLCCQSHGENLAEHGMLCEIPKTSGMLYLPSAQIAIICLPNIMDSAQEFKIKVVLIEKKHKKAVIVLLQKIFVEIPLATCVGLGDVRDCFIVRMISP